MGLGIHNNSECNRCGACCIYYSIFLDRDLSTPYSHTPCKQLEQGESASCLIHASKPTVCRDFFCGDVSKAVQAELKEVFVRMKNHR